MDEIIELLRELNESVPMPLELPSEDDIVLVEEEILVQLDRQFRIYLLELSDIVYGSYEPVTIADPQSHTYLPEVAAVAWEGGMSRELIPFCQVGDDYYCVDMEGRMVFWKREGPGGVLTEDFWENIWEWMREIWLDNQV